MGRGQGHVSLSAHAGRGSLPLAWVINGLAGKDVVGVDLGIESLQVAHRDPVGGCDRREGPVVQRVTGAAAWKHTSASESGSVTNERA